MTTPIDRMPRTVDEWTGPGSYTRMLNERLRRYGAATFGSVRRREERLDRFRAAELKREKAQMLVEEAREAEQQRIRTRAAQRAYEMIAEAEFEAFCLTRLWRAVQNGFVTVRQPKPSPQ